MTGDRARQRLAELLALDGLDVLDTNRNARVHVDRLDEGLKPYLSANRQVISVGELDVAVYHGYR